MIGECAAPEFVGKSNVVRTSRPLSFVARRALRAGRPHHDKKESLSAFSDKLPYRRPPGNPRRLRQPSESGAISPGNTHI